jgi:hypothetical protein
MLFVIIGPAILLQRLWSHEEFSRFQTLTVVNVDERQRGHGAEIEFCAERHA